MQVLKDLLHSEKAVLGILLVVVSAVLVGLGKVSSTEWLDYTWKIFLAYSAGKGLQAIGAGVGAKTECCACCPSNPAVVEADDEK